MKVAENGDVPPDNFEFVRCFLARFRVRFLLFRDDLVFEEDARWACSDVWTHDVGG